MKNFIEKLSNRPQNINILMVDDRPENLIALEAILASPNYRLFSANSGEEALRQVLLENFAVILLDVQMPGLNGFDTARLIKSREKTKQIPIIFISAINQAAEHVKLQSELLRVIGDTSSDTVVTTDENGIMLHMNPVVASMFGYRSDELIGRHIDSIVPALSFRTKERGITKLIETEALRKDASQFPADIQLGESVIDGHRIYIYSIRDVTRRKLLEEERFRKIFDATPCLIALRSLKDHRYIAVNESLLSAVGYRKDEVINRSADVFQYMIESDELEGSIDGLSEPESPVRNVRISYMTKSGELREGLLSTEMMQVHGEKCLLIVVTDITDRVFFEKEMARLDRLNVTGEMAAGIVHEIRNPMTTVRGFLQLSKTRPSTEYTDIMIEELDRAHNIVTEFLSVAGSNPTNRKFKQLNAVVEALYPLIHSKAMCSNHHVSLELGSCPPLQLDEKEIRQLLLNLALNGLDAMPVGGTLTIKTYYGK